ncbi:MAG: SCO family protein [Gammaproteobacteria bacterium]|tara:strand:+ start:192 stop:776 length:585 start_codon:yes stop_codon:yes gene_type:complete
MQQISLRNYIKYISLILVIITSNDLYADIGGDFTLKDQYNNKFTLSDSSKVKIVFFGFLNCPDICPTTLTEVANLLKKLEGLSKNIDPIFITVDPTRDTPELLKNYLSFFDERIIGLTGTQEEIEKVSNQYHVYYSYQNKGKVEDYTVNHTANMYFVDEKNNVEKIFVPGTPFSEFYKYVNRYLMKDIKNLPLQ